MFAVMVGSILGSLGRVGTLNRRVAFFSQLAMGWLCPSKCGGGARGGWVDVVFPVSQFTVFQSKKNGLM